jgi:hypothetical protein
LWLDHDVRDALECAVLVAPSVVDGTAARLPASDLPVDSLRLAELLDRLEPRLLPAVTAPAAARPRHGSGMLLLDRVRAERTAATDLALQQEDLRALSCLLRPDGGSGDSAAAGLARRTISLALFLPPASSSSLPPEPQGSDGEAALSPAPPRKKRQRSDLEEREERAAAGERAGRDLPWACAVLRRLGHRAELLELTEAGAQVWEAWLSDHQVPLPVPRTLADLAEPALLGATGDVRSAHRPSCR